MSSHLLRPRLEIHHPVPVRPPGARPEFAFWGLGVGAVIGALVAVGGTGALFRTSMALMGLIFGLGLLYVRALANSAVSGHVRVADDSLTFVRPASLAILPAAIAAAGFAFGAISLFAPAWSGERFGLSGGVGPLALWAGVVGASSVAWLATQLWALRLPVGLTVSEHGLSGLRGGADVRIPWERVEAVKVESGRAGAQLVVTAVGGSAVAVHAAHLGSDPNVVAAVLEHFWTYPEHRCLLGDAREAIRLVEDALA